MHSLMRWFEAKAIALSHPLSAAVGACLREFSIRAVAQTGKTRNPPFALRDANSLWKNADRARLFINIEKELHTNPVKFTFLVGFPFSLHTAISVTLPTYPSPMPPNWRACPLH